MFQPNFAPAAYGQQPQRPQQPFYNAQQPQQWGQQQSSFITQPQVQPQPYMEQLQFQPQQPALAEMFGGAPNAHEQARQQAYQTGAMQPPPGYASPANQNLAQGRRARGLDAADEMTNYALAAWGDWSDQQRADFMESRYWDNLSPGQQQQLSSDKRPAQQTATKRGGTPIPQYPVKKKPTREQTEAAMEQQRIAEHNANLESNAFYGMALSQPTRPAPALADMLGGPMWT